VASEEQNVRADHDTCHRHDVQRSEGRT
jgi:hypothetical protein